MPTPVILFYSPTPQVYTSKLFQLCAIQSVRLRLLDIGDLGRPLSALAQNVGPEDPPPLEEPLPEPVLILCHFSNEQLDRALASLRKLRVSCLKAVLTPTNVRWTPRELYLELCRERDQLGGAHAPQA